MASSLLAGQTVLITGASRGIGAEVAARVTALGARVIRIARSPFPPLAGSVDIQADLADPAERDRAFREVTARHGLPDAVVSNAGGFAIAPIEDTTDARARAQLAINVEAPLALARHFLPAMRDRGRGIHVLIGSVADHRAFAGNAAYAASKYAARGLHEVLCEEFRGTGVHCTLVSPGPTDTAVWNPIDPDHTEGFTPRAEMMRPADVADAVVFALTSKAHVELIRLGPP